MRELMEVPEALPGKERSWVGLSFGTMLPSAARVFWRATPIGATTALGMWVACSGSSGRSQPNLTSGTMRFDNFWAAWLDADLWLPYAMACLASSLATVGPNGDTEYTLPLDRRFSILDQFAWE